LLWEGTSPRCHRRAPAEWPEFREYIERKYPRLDEDMVNVFEAYIERRLMRPRGS
jgi:hypothetical protein